ncbi:uncharacterized protein KY384_007598 [Bacidia gigantensis]|uniref:uncharacterized protein n=1 Tax=Bacidia gigantensis TaxID=2732470 RepID=UPI001D0428F3|nr:uncharacterized protein KY384_007598 [Bacidia gigantensis]KAG8527446.1 hypothetical protein KY384_007598 [Bacidia gigantensis]
MATVSGLIDFLRASFPSQVPPTSTELDLNDLSQKLYPKHSYTENEKVEVSQWLITSSHLASPGEDEAKHLERLGSLNIHLSTRTTLLGSKPSIADLALYYRLRPTVRDWSPEQRTGERGHHHIVRHIDAVQNAPLFGLSLEQDEKVNIDPSDVKFVHKPLDAKEEKERKKKEKASAATAIAAAKSTHGPTSLPAERSKDESTKSAAPSLQGVASEPAKNIQPSTKKEKKVKEPKQAKAAPAPAPAPLSPRLIDLRVGHIVKAIHHPDADSLYVSTIACGDSPNTENTFEYEGQTVRTVCSGLNGLVPLEEMQGRKIVAVCNLKPVTMRGIKSAAMVLAASPRLKEGEVDDHKGPVELVDPPEGTSAGERLSFEGWEGEPEGQLNPKKKIFETLQPGFTTTQEGRVGFDNGDVEALKGEVKPLGMLKTKSGGICKVKTLKGAIVR